MNAPTNKAEYDTLMAHIETYLQKVTTGGGFDCLTDIEGDELARLSLLAEAYEDSIPLMPVVIETPKDLPEMIGLRMFQRKLNQREMAQLLEVPETRLSEVLRGKRRISLTMAKQLRMKLAIDADFILEHA